MFGMGERGQGYDRDGLGSFLAFETAGYLKSRDVR